MSVPVRYGMKAAEWERAVAPLDRGRDKALRRAGADHAGGSATLWYSGRRTATLTIQPGMADDLPSLASALAAQIGWPHAALPPGGAGGQDPARVVAVWARVWQVRDRADLRLTVYWDEHGALHGAAALLLPDGTQRPLLDTAEVIALFDEVAVSPRHSASPHGLLLAANSAMDQGAYADARNLYERALRALPNHVEAHRNYALALARLDDWEAATRAMARAHDLAPHDQQLAAEYLALETDAGVRAVQQGEPARGAEHFLRILAQWPEEPTALVNLGNLRLRERRVPEARAIFRRFLAQHPRHPAADAVRQALADLGEDDRT